MIPEARSPRSRRKPDAARRLRDVLRAEILSAEGVRGLLPSEGELMLRHGAGRNVVRAALALLQREGLVTRVQGAGTFVVVQKIRHRMKGALGISRSVRGSERRVLCTILTAHEDMARARVARELDVPDGHPCGVFDVLITIDDVPAVLMTSYVPLDLAGPDFRAMVATGEWYGDWYQALDRLAVAYASEFALEAVLADEFVAPHLDLHEGEPVLLCERVLRDEDGHAFEYGFSYCRGDRVSFVLETRHELPGIPGGTA